MTGKPPARIFYSIVVSPLCCTPLCVASNPIMAQAHAVSHRQVESIGYVLSLVQLGFIIGTLTFSVFGFSDRFAPSLVFLLCSLIVAAFNALSLVDAESLNLTLFTRFATGFFLAGVYPVGVKIASDWKQEGLGHWLGALV